MSDSIFKQMGSTIKTHLDNAIATLQAQITNKISASEKGVADGVATLDGTGFMIRSYDSGSIFIDGAVRVNSTCYAVLCAYRGGKIQGHTASTMTISTPITVTYFALSQIQGIIEVPGISYTGSAVSGTKYRADYNSFIGLWGKTMPGSTAGTVGAMSSIGD